MSMLSRVVLAVLMSAVAIPALAQSPNTAALLVVVVDQSGAVVTGRQGHGRERRHRRHPRGDVRCRRRRRRSAALPLTGTYTVSVSKAGFTADDLDWPDAARRRNRHRAGEAGGQRRQVRGDRLRHHAGRSRRSADRPLARQRDHRRDADPRPQGHLAAAAERLVPAGEGHRRPVRQRDLLRDRGRRPPPDHRHPRRRQQRRGVGPPDHDRDGAGRCHPGDFGALERVLGRVRLDRRPGAEHRHQVRHQCAARRRPVYGPSWRLAGQDVRHRPLLPAVRRHLHDPDDADRDQPG